MKIELLGSWSFTPPKKRTGPFFCTAGRMIGAHLADGTFEVRRGDADLPVVASLSLPKGARVALDPLGERLAHVVGSTLTLVSLSGKTIATFELDADVDVSQLVFRDDGRRLWVFGHDRESFRVCALDRDLQLDWHDRLDIGEEASPGVEILHPTKDEFAVLTQSGGDDPDEATSGRLGVVREKGRLKRTFVDEVVEHPFVAFTVDGKHVVGTDFVACVLYGWPGGAAVRSVEQPEGFEGGLGGVVVGNLLLTERHLEAKPDTTSSLLVLSLPRLEEVAVIPWTKRGAFAKPRDNAGLDLCAALEAESFVELSPGKKGVWTCRAWRVVNLGGGCFSQSTALRRDGLAGAACAAPSSFRKGVEVATAALVAERGSS